MTRGPAIWTEESIARGRAAAARRAFAFEILALAYLAQAKPSDLIPLLPALAGPDCPRHRCASCAAAIDRYYRRESYYAEKERAAVRRSDHADAAFQAQLRRRMLAEVGEQLTRCSH